MSNPENTSPEEIRELLKDPSYLPTAEQVKAAFPIKDEQLNIHPDWDKFCKENKIYQLFTVEMIQDIASHLIEKINVILSDGNPESMPVTILELGAGDGRLSHFLEEELKKRGFTQAVNVVATDDMSWRSQDKTAKTDFIVEELSADAAMEKYGKTGNVIVVSSWMPQGENWTSKCLPFANVKTMLLIGDIESTGTGEETWRPEGFTTEPITDNVRGNFGVSQQSPHHSYGQSEIAFVSKS